MLREALARLRYGTGIGLAGVVHHDAYRVPLSSVEAQSGFEPRRADLVLWFLQEMRVVRPEQLVRPLPATWAELGRVHASEYLESLSGPDVLARIFAVDPSELQVDALLGSLRLACGGTIEAARLALRTRRSVLNLAGGFHHAGIRRGGGFCALNDVAVALAAVRAEGFSGRVLILDVDAHPPDGTAECIAGDSAVWLGSISGSSWGPLSGVDEVVLPPGSGDQVYLAALDALMDRMPSGELAFVVAGGDVLAGDRLGMLALSLAGHRERDLRIAHRLQNMPSVWVPAGGYGPAAWRALAGTALALSRRSRRPVSPRYDPLARRYASIARELTTEQLGDEPILTAADIEEALGIRPMEEVRLLGFYTAEGLEFALSRYGVLSQLERLGYSRFRVELTPADEGQRARLYGSVNGREHLLVDLVVSRKRLAGLVYLYVNWLSLRHPLARFSDKRPQLPGQEVPGLGLAREFGELLGLMARRLSLDGVAFRPAWYHTAYAGRYRCRFLTPERQGRFEALRRDLAAVSLLEATHALAGGRVRLEGQPYAWEADEMVYVLDPRPDPAYDRRTQVERERVHFSIDPAPAASAGL